MSEWISVMVIAAVMVLALGVLAFVQARKQAAIRAKNPGFPKGHFKGQGMGIGIAIGAGMGVAMGNIAIGVAVGVAIGAAIGQQLEKKHQDEIRPATPEEAALKRQALLVTFGTLALGLIAFVITYLAGR